MSKKPGVPPKVLGLLRREDGEEYVHWQDSKGGIHVTDGIHDHVDAQRVKEWLFILEPTESIDVAAMAALAIRYQNENEFIEALTTLGKGRMP